ncbi:MAG: hypothetical protein M1482_15675, partial [Chloroflexi bacterium]|nr:hypothetical protein [Chloroflexota bacterium]
SRTFRRRQRQALRRGTLVSAVHVPTDAASRRGRRGLRKERRWPQLFLVRSASVVFAAAS